MIVGRIFFESQNLESPSLTMLTEKSEKIIIFQLQIKSFENLEPSWFKVGVFELTKNWADFEQL